MHGRTDTILDEWQVEQLLRTETLLFVSQHACLSASLLSTSLSL